jgi:putative oxidoreductase
MSMIRSLSHILLSGIFIAGGADAFLNPGHRVNKVEASGIPEPEQAVVFNGAVMVIAGLALALGIAPKLAATVLIGSLVPTTVVGHAFWKEETVAGRKNQLTQFFKNLGLIGGLMLVLQEK